MSSPVSAVVSAAIAASGVGYQLRHDKDDYQRNDTDDYIFDMPSVSWMPLPVYSTSRLPV